MQSRCTLSFLWFLALTRLSLLFSQDAMSLGNMVRDFSQQYEAKLRELTFNSKPIINSLTILADETKPLASKVVELIVARIMSVSATPPFSSSPLPFFSSLRHPLLRHQSSFSIKRSIILLLACASSIPSVPPFFLFGRYGFGVRAEAGCSNQPTQGGWSCLETHFARVRVIGLLTCGCGCACMWVVRIDVCVAVG
jgi:hypothetical protein